MSGLIALGMSPFIVYMVIRASHVEPTPPWPDDVAVMASSGGDLKQLLVLHPTKTGAVLITLPADTTLDAPSAGLLRASTIFHLGGAKLVADGVRESTGLRLPYWAEWNGAAVTTSVSATKGNLGSHTTDLARLLTRAAENQVLIAPGQWRVQGGVKEFVLDRKGFSTRINGGVVPASPAPTTAPPSTSPSPTLTSSNANANVPVEVLSQGADTGTASRVGAQLIAAGFVDVTITKSGRAAIDGIAVYFANDRAAAEAVATLLGVPTSQVKRIPGVYSTNAEVLVVVGRQAASPSTSSSTV